MAIKISPSDIANETFSLISSKDWMYRITTMLVIGAILFFGGFYFGSVSKDNKLTAYARKIKELQETVTVYRDNVREKIVVQYVDRVNVVKEKVYVYREKAATVVPSVGELSNGWVYIHDEAATSAANREIEDSRASDATPSGIKDTEALGTIAENYGICHQNSEKLKALQQIISEDNRKIDELNKKIKKSWWRWW